MNLLVKRVGGADVPLPQYHSSDAAGLDLPAAEEAVIKPGDRQLISTGIHVEIPKGHFGMITPRSGLAHTSGISIVNSPGIIDADYRGIVKVNLINLGKEDFHIKRGDRIAQMIIVPFVQGTIKEIQGLSDTERGDGGFGSTG